MKISILLGAIFLISGYAYGVPELCGELPVLTVTSTGTSTNTDQGICMSNAVQFCTSNVYVQSVNYEAECYEACLDMKTPEGQTGCFGLITFSPFQCTITDVQWVPPGQYNCTAQSGEVKVACTCWSEPI